MVAALRLWERLEIALDFGRADQCLAVELDGGHLAAGQNFVDRSPGNVERGSSLIDRKRSVKLHCGILSGRGHQRTVRGLKKGRSP